MTASSALGTKERPLKVGIVGAGPAGFYAAMALLEQQELSVTVSLLDRLPTPYGLVRAGVAPDHQKLKGVTRVYEQLAQDPRFRFFGHVELGRDVRVAELLQCFDQIVYATGNESDRRLGIPGEHLIGCTPASVFVGWYNGHPDYRHAAFDLSGSRAAIIGNGNVAMDVARMLLKSSEELRTTDIADHALSALAASRIREVVILGRRGPLQASFTPSELKELTQLPDVHVLVDSSAFELDESTRRELDLLAAKNPARRNFELFQQLSRHANRSAPRRLEFRFLTSPLEFLGDASGRLRQLRVCKNELVRTPNGGVQAEPTSAEALFDVDLALVSVGSESKRIADLPFDAARGVIANVDGRVVDPETRERRPNQYCTGWARTGAKGLIASQKTGAAATVATLLTDVRDRTTGNPPERLDLANLLRAKGVDWIDFDDWRALDRQEIARGASRGAPRSKLVDIPTMLSLVELERRGW